MSGTDRIKAKILEDAKNNTEQNLSEARSEAQSLISAAEKDALARLAKAKATAEEDAANLKKRMQAVASLEERKRMLKVRQDMVGAAFEAAVEKTVGLPEKEYGNLLMGFILKSVRDGECEILFNEADKARLGAKYVQKINDTLKSMGKASSLKLSPDTVRSRGGFILKYGEMEINSTLEIILSILRPKIEVEVAAVLFKP